MTYASFGAPVAPGQIDIDELLTSYRVGVLNAQSQLTAVCIAGEEGLRRVGELNASYAGSNRVAVGFTPEDRPLIEECTGWMPVAEIIS